MKRTRLTCPARTRETFLQHFAATGNVTLACQMTGISRTAVYEWKEADPDFAQAWQDAGERATDALEAEARRRAVEGVDEPVFQQGRLVGHVRRYSDKLLEFLLRGNRDKYRAATIEINLNNRLDISGAMRRADERLSVYREGRTIDVTPGGPPYALPVPPEFHRHDKPEGGSDE